jgi:hypothetical protein
MLSTTLFLGREGMRLAFVRCDPGGPATFESRRQRQRLVNLAWLSAPVGLALTAAVACAYVWLFPEEDSRRRATAMLYCAGGALESLVEPLFILAQTSLQTSVRAQAEGTAALLRGLATYAGMVWFGLGVAAFGFSQLLHGAALALAYVRFFFWGVGAAERRRSCGFEAAAELLPRALPPGSGGDGGGGGGGVKGVSASGAAGSVGGAGSVSGGGVYFSGTGESLWLAASFSGQSVFKHLLTEGGRIVLSLGGVLARPGGEKNLCISASAVVCVCIVC